MPNKRAHKKTPPRQRGLRSIDEWPFLSDATTGLGEVLNLAPIFSGDRKGCYIITRKKSKQKEGSETVKRYRQRITLEYNRLRYGADDILHLIRNVAMKAGATLFRGILLFSGCVEQPKVNKDLVYATLNEIFRTDSVSIKFICGQFDPAGIPPDIRKGFFPTDSAFLGAQFKKHAGLLIETGRLEFYSRAKKKFEKMRIDMNKWAIHRILRIRTPTQTWTINPDQHLGSVTESYNPPDLGPLLDPVAGQDTILGKPCQVVEHQHGIWIWFWKDIPLKKLPLWIGGPDVGEHATRRI